MQNRYVVTLISGIIGTSIAEWRTNGQEKKGVV